MRKIHVFLISFLIVFIIGISVYIYSKVLLSKDNNKEKTIIKKEIDYYKQVWKDTFLGYQKSETSIPDFGAYEFSINVTAEGDSSDLENIYDFEENFSNIGLEVFGDYDFSDKKSLSIKGNARLYLNSSFNNRGDIEIYYELNSGKDLTYKINNFNKKILDVLGLGKTTKKAIIAHYENNKGKEKSIDVSNNFLGEIIDTIKKESKDGPLYENTKKEEQKIVNSFIDNEVIDVYSGKTLKNKNIDKLNFRFDTDSFIDFMEEVSKIIGKDKNFQQDRKIFKDFLLKGFFKIKDNIIIDSNINTELPIKSYSKKSGKTNYELLILQTRFKLPSINKIDFGIVTSIKSKSSPENALKINLKGKIK